MAIIALLVEVRDRSALSAIGKTPETVGNAAVGGDAVGSDRYRRGTDPIGMGELIWKAAQGSVLHDDDTGMRILRLTREPGDKRTGTFTSGIISIVGHGPSRCSSLDGSMRARNSPMC